MGRKTIQLALAIGIVGLMWTVSRVDTADAHSNYSCSSCHTPHNATGGDGDNATVPLWNPDHDTTTLTGEYGGSSTMQGDPTAPTGRSALCLSCHDGTYDHVTPEHSLGANNAMGGLVTTHPISFIYGQTLFEADGDLVDPSTLDDDVLDANGQMDCTSCHEVHDMSNTAPDIMETVQDVVRDDNGDPVLDESGAEQPLFEEDGVTPVMIEVVDVNQPKLRWPYGASRGDTSAFCRNCHVK